MAFDSDVAILGTGVAALACANRLKAEGKSVLLLNPDRDFFGEDSELPLDPFWPASTGNLDPRRLLRNTPERALEQLRPDFPGSLEQWTASDGPSGPRKARAHRLYRDPLAPHVRARSRLWLGTSRSQDWEALERLYVEASDAGLAPRLLEGVFALKRFPGISARGISQAGDEEDLRGLLIPRICDVDVTRYRVGLLEYVRETLGPRGIISGASQIELIPDGIRFHEGRTPHTARIREDILVFWTPRLSPWVLGQAKRAEVQPLRPHGVRLWEEWSLASRERLDPGIVGMFDDLAVWAEIEGSPEDELSGTTRLDHLIVLRPGPLVPVDAYPQAGPSSSWGMNWASSESFRDLMELCQELMKWDKFSIRSMRPRAIFEWGKPGSVMDQPASLQEQKNWVLSESGPSVQVIGGCDGPLVEVMRAAREACERVGRVR